MLDVATARALLHRTRPRRSRDGYPAAVRAQVVPLVADAMATGRSMSSIARGLGVSAATLSRWVETAPGAAHFLPVVVGPSAMPSHKPPTGGLRLISPSGYQLEGLDLDGAICALQRLR
jgi:hypothetical protein